MRFILLYEANQVSAVGVVQSHEPDIVFAIAFEQSAVFVPQIMGFDFEFPSVRGKLVSNRLSREAKPESARLERHLQAIDLSHCEPPNTKRRIAFMVNCAVAPTDTTVIIVCSAHMAMMAAPMERRSIIVIYPKANRLRKPPRKP
jgi:hypothetical protein